MKVFVAILIVLTLISTGTAQTQAMVKGDAAAWDEVMAAWQRLPNLKSYRMQMVPAPGTDGADKMSIVNEVVNPGRLRFVIDMPEMMTIEMIKVDKELRRRITLKGEMAEAAKAQPSLADQIFSGGIGSIVEAILDPVGFVTGVVTNIVMSAIIQNMMPKAPKFGVWTCEEGEATQASSRSSPNEVSVARLPDTTIEGAKDRGYDVTMGVVQDGKNMTTRMRVYILSDRQMLRRMEMLQPDGTLQGTMEYSDFDAPISIELPKCD
jgi:hypothetical protein